MSLASGLYRHRGLVPVVPVLAVLVWARPQSPRLEIGITLMVLGEGVRLWGAAYLGGTARSRSPRATKLVTRGPYAHTRHPLYWGNFALTLGFVLAAGAAWPMAPGLVALGFAVLYGSYARQEEEALAAQFPEIHAAYRQGVPAWRWVLRPRRFPDAGDTGRASLRRAWSVEAKALHAEAWLLVLLWARTRLPAGG